MNVFVSRELKQSDRDFAISEIEKEFHGASIISDEFTSCRFRIVGISEFEQHVSKNPPPLSITALQNIAEKGMTLKEITIPDCGLINLHLYNTHVAFSGLNCIIRQKYKVLVRQMGGLVDNRLNKYTNVLITNNSQTERTLFAQRQKIKCVLPSWFDDLQSSNEYIPPDNHMIKLLTGLVFAFTGVRDEQAHFAHVITENGGIASDGLTTQTNCVITCETPTSTIAQISLRRNLMFFSPDAIKEIESERNPQPNAPPCVSSTLFHDKSFKIDFRDPKKSREVGKMIRENSGSVGKGITISDRDDGTGNCRSICWLVSCIESGSILDQREFPLFIPPKNPKEMKKGTLISTTGFTDGQVLLNVIEGINMIGAVHSKNLTKKVSYLIANKQSGSKYEMALKWGITVVSVDALELWANDGDDADLSQVILAKNQPQKVTTQNIEEIKRVAQNFISDESDDDESLNHVILSRPLKIVSANYNQKSDFSQKSSSNNKTEKSQKTDNTNNKSDNPYKSDNFLKSDNTYKSDSFKKSDKKFNDDDSDDGSVVIVSQKKRSENTQKIEPTEGVKKVNFLTPDTTPVESQQQQGNQEQTIDFLSSDDEVICPEIQQYISQSSGTFESDLSHQNTQLSLKSQLDHINKLEEEQRKQRELEEKRKKEEEIRRQQELEERKRKEEEIRRRKEIEEEKRKKELEEKRRKEIEEEKRRKEEEIRKQKELEEKRRKEIEEEKRKQREIEEENRKQRETEEEKRKKEEELERRRREEIEKMREIEEEKKRKELEEKQRKEKEEEERKKKKEMEEKQMFGTLMKDLRRMTKTPNNEYQDKPQKKKIISEEELTMFTQIPRAESDDSYDDVPNDIVYDNAHKEKEKDRDDKDTLLDILNMSQE
ncbi:virulent strain associated lipoprotein, putative [Trichomonas vaginalis G3]|uniref:Virulent strain associated lipoprotein, putative n=1 Tax=Trichomonas vaginalis (strain ATCC PRA-98 / G3) TaxID=412133 RepID=A2FSC9_TRIV3|nr:DNA REPLIcation regulator DPB11-related family [Trichomonas vaginalis G3]EAX92188.1 virulent strain associated lipoprotein, putative [Trichomonas vaginalis G3]KAI5488463.1 DNA REPLIcation regulator DPB11-related family [Trichomonas vaginalis G3]|eukprot:XP_001305118.1 virulent strain associated lipoprotein [Trichomonas vaginalis G3]